MIVERDNFLTELLPVAKLARLMLGPPEFIEPEYLAETEEHIAGELQLDVMQRLRELLYRDSGRVVFSLNFVRSEDAVCVTGEFRANIELVCQRCLQPFTTELANTIRTCIATDEVALEHLDEDFEPLITAEKKIPLNEFIEDEMLLSMPLAAAHDPGACPGEQLVQSMKTKKKNPFEVLKDLKIKNS